MEERGPTFAGSKGSAPVAGGELEPRTALRTDDYVAVQALVAADLGVAVIPSLCVGPAAYPLLSHREALVVGGGRSPRPGGRPCGGCARRRGDRVAAGRRTGTGVVGGVELDLGSVGPADAGGVLAGSGDQHGGLVEAVGAGDVGKDADGGVPVGVGDGAGASQLARTANSASSTSGNSPVQRALLAGRTRSSRRCRARRRVGCAAR